jgi:hypothetical protein
MTLPVAASSHVFQLIRRYLLRQAGLAFLSLFGRTFSEGKSQGGSEDLTGSLSLPILTGFSAK